jgi:hypothetical protein
MKRASTARPGRHREPGQGHWGRQALRGAGLLAGAGIAVHLLPSFQIPDGPPPLPLVVDATVVRSGEVGTVDGSLLLSQADVRPGSDGTASGWLELASETSSPVDVTVQDVGLPIGLENELWVRVTLGDTVVFNGSQAQLRSTPSTAVRVPPGAEVPIGITVSLPQGVSDGHQGRHTELKLRVASPAAAGSVVAPVSRSSSASRCSSGSGTSLAAARTQPCPARPATRTTPSPPAPSS